MGANVADFASASASFVAAEHMHHVSSKKLLGEVVVDAEHTLEFVDMVGWQKSKKRKKGVKKQNKISTVSLLTQNDLIGDNLPVKQYLDHFHAIDDLLTLSQSYQYFHCFEHYCYCSMM